MSKPTPEQSMTPEFGHQSAIMNDGTFCIDGWGAGPFFIEVGKKRYRFGDSDRFGPYLADRHGDPIKNELPPERSHFWRAYNAWKHQGRRLAEDGKSCIYEPLKPTKWRRVARGFNLIVEHGDKGGGYEEVS